jgi:hypothetical protein
MAKFWHSSPLRGVEPSRARRIAKAVRRGEAVADPADATLAIKWAQFVQSRYRIGRRVLPAVMAFGVAGWAVAGHYFLAAEVGVVLGLPLVVNLWFTPRARRSQSANEALAPPPPTPMSVRNRRAALAARGPDYPHSCDPRDLVRIFLPWLPVGLSVADERRGSDSAKSRPVGCLRWLGRWEWACASWDSPQVDKTQPGRCLAGYGECVAVVVALPAVARLTLLSLGAEARCGRGYMR